MTDASDVAVGAVLQQHIGAQWRTSPEHSSQLKLATVRSIVLQMPYPE